MKVVQIVFSPTGGTQQVADTITAEWGSDINKIDLTDPQNDYSDISIAEDDIAVIAVPSYGGRVPALAAERLKKINGNQAKCIIVCVYGNRAYDDTLVELNDIAEQNHFKVIAAISAIAEHSIIHQYATGRPDQADRDELHNFAGKILKKMNEADSDDTAVLQIPGKRPYKKAGGVVLIPKANHQCNSCGLCAKNCPAQAISMENLKIADSKKCISCMRCVVQCPQSARKVNAAMVAAAALAIKKACFERKSNELFIRS